MSINDNFLSMLPNCTIEEAEVVIQKMKKNEEMKKFAIEKLNGEPKHEMKKKGAKTQEQYRYSTRINGKQVSFTGKTPEVVYRKVWDYYHTSKNRLTRNASLSEVFFAYLEEKKKDESLSSETTRNQLLDWNRFIKNHKLANMPIKDISVYDLKKYFSDLTKRGALKKKAAGKPYAIFRAVFDYAVPDYCEHNIANEINLSNYKFSMANDIHIYTDEEVNQLLSYIESLPQDIYTLAIRLFFCFNMRIGEFRALTWKDYDEDNALMRVCHQVVIDTVDGKRTTVDLPYTKGNKETGIRTLQVVDEAKEILSHLRKINGNKHYILQGKQGAKFPITTKHFNEHLKKYCEACGVPYYSSHKIRYLGITKLYEAGVDEATIQKTAGHANIDTTRKYNKDRRTCSVDSEVWNGLFGRRKKA